MSEEIAERMEKPTPLYLLRRQHNLAVKIIAIGLREKGLGLDWLTKLFADRSADWAADDLLDETSVWLAMNDLMKSVMREVMKNGRKRSA